MAVRILDHDPGDPPVLSGETGDHKDIETMSRAVIKDIESYIQTLLFRRPTVLKVKVTGCAEYINPRGRWYPQPASIVTLEKWNEATNAWVRVTPVPPLNYNDEILLDVGIWRITVIQGLVTTGNALPPRDQVGNPTLRGVSARHETDGWHANPDHSFVGGQHVPTATRANPSPSIKELTDGPHT